jgi:hypothetical protein
MPSPPGQRRWRDCCEPSVWAWWAGRIASFAWLPAMVLKIQSVREAAEANAAPCVPAGELPSGIRDSIGR